MASLVCLWRLQQCASWPQESIHLVCGAKLKLFFGVLSEKRLRDLGFLQGILSFLSLGCFLSCSNE